MYFRKIKNKYILLPLGLFFLCFILSSCDNSNIKSTYIQYKFPLQNEDVENVLKQNNLLWILDKSKSKFNEKYTYHLLVDSQNKPICGINSNNNNEGKYLEIKGFPPRKDIKSIYKEEWQNIFKFAFELYGDPSQSQDIYNNFIDYINNKNNNEVMYWRTRVDDMHITISYFLKEDVYSLKNIIIMDNNNFEILLKSRENTWSEFLNNYEIKSGGILKVSEILTEENTNTIEGVIIKGHLKNIQQLTNKKIIPQYKLISYHETFLTAELVDNTGSIPVILRSTSLNKDELEEERKHYIFNINGTYIVNFSVR